MKFQFQEHNGAKYHHFCVDEERNGVMAVGKSKIVLKGNLRVTLTQNSYKYDSELQFRILTHKDSKKAYKKIRHESQWNTVEINLPIKDLDKIIFALKEIKKIKESENNGIQEKKT